jgi:hypothetical protein
MELKNVSPNGEYVVPDNPIEVNFILENCRN